MGEDKFFNSNDIKDICYNYGVNFKNIINVIDSSCSDEDKRYNYIVDNKYVLKITNSTVIT